MTKLIKFELMQRIAEVLDETKVLIANEADWRMVNQGGNDEHTATLYRAVNKITDLSKQLNNLEGADEYIALSESIKSERNQIEIAKAKKFGGAEFLYFHTIGQRIEINNETELENAISAINMIQNEQITEGI